MTLVFSKDEMEALENAINSTGNLDDDLIWHCGTYKDIFCVVLKDTSKDIYSVTFKKDNNIPVNDVEDISIKITDPDAWRQK